MKFLDCSTQWCDWFQYSCLNVGPLMSTYRCIPMWFPFYVTFLLFDRVLNPFIFENWTVEWSKSLPRYIPDICYQWMGSCKLVFWIGDDKGDRERGNNCNSLQNIYIMCLTIWIAFLFFPLGIDMSKRTKASIKRGILFMHWPSVNIKVTYCRCILKISPKIWND